MCLLLLLVAAAAGFTPPSEAEKEAAKKMSLRRDQEFVRGLNETRKCKVYSVGTAKPGEVQRTVRVCHYDYRGVRLSIAVSSWIKLGQFSILALPPVEKGTMRKAEWKAFYDPEAPCKLLVSQEVRGDENDVLTVYEGYAAMFDLRTGDVLVPRDAPACGQ